MGKLIDITGERFKRLVVVRKTNRRDKNGSVYWECKCDCGNLIEANSKSLRCGGTQSCGCWSTESRYLRTKEMVGKKFNRLTVISKVEEQDRYRQNFYTCRCDCGKITKTRGYALRNGSIKSCGCLAKEVNSNRAIDLTGVKVGRLLVIKKTDRKTKRGAYWLCECECGEVKELLGEVLREKKTLSCGCLRIEAMRKMRGKNSPHYKKELTDEERMLGRHILGKIPIRNWRNSVYEKDNYTCKICNQTGKELNAHHLDGWNWCKEKRFDVDNGTTLCRACHYGFHSIYGRGDNTKEQFEEFKLI